MSEWTKERHEELKGIAHDCGTNVFSHVRSRELIDAVYEIERLQSEVDKINAILKDPAAVRLNILRGLIVLPEDYIEKYSTGGEYQKLLLEKGKLQGYVSKLIAAGNKISEDYSPDTISNHEKECPYYRYHSREYECTCGYVERNNAWTMLVDEVENELMQKDKVKQ